MNLSQNHTELKDALIHLRQQFDLSFAQTAHQENQDLVSLLAIRIEDDPYAIRITEIAGLHVDCRITPLPTTVPELLGVTGFRGQITPVYDLAALLGYARASHPRWVIVLRSREPVALAFDRFELHISVSSQMLLSSLNDIPLKSNAATPYLSGAVYNAERLLPIIQLQSLLHAICQKAGTPIQKRSIPS